MFGYIKIDKYELKYKYIVKYKNLYCSICNSLKENLGLKGCLFTSYDATLFLAIFDGLDISNKEYVIQCPLNPLRRKKPAINISETALNYTTFISGFYIFTKLKDNIKDENTIRHRIRYKKFCNNKKFQKLLHSHKTILETLNKKTDEYYLLEHNNNADFDELSNKIGDLFGTAFREFSSIVNNNINTKALYNVGYNIGKWIYLADAFDDITEDKKRNSFNPILKMDNYPSISDTLLCDKIIFMSQCLTQQIYQQLSILGLNKNQEIIENILTYGMNNSIKRISKKNFNYER